MEKIGLATVIKFQKRATLSLSTIVASPVFAQSQKAYETAACNASFLGCSGGAVAAPIGDLGSSFLELAIIGTLITVISVSFSLAKRKDSR